MAGSAHGWCVDYNSNLNIDYRHTSLPGLMMTASQTGLGNFFVERNLAMQEYHIVGCPPSTQLPSHINALSALPFSYSGLPGYNFIPYPQTRHMVRHLIMRSVIIKRSSTTTKFTL